MATSKFMTSISTIPNQSKYQSDSKYHTTAFRQFNNPFKQQLPIKFPKRKIRRQTQANMLTQTLQNPQRSSIRNFPIANNSSQISGQPQKHIRYYKIGLFNSLQRQSEQILPINRSLQDIGAMKNRKKINYFVMNKPDPIIIGERDQKHNSTFEKSWKQPRRHRDNGIKCGQVFEWKSKKSKSYLQMYRDYNKKKKEVQNTKK